MCGGGDCARGVAGICGGGWVCEGIGVREKERPGEGGCEGDGVVMAGEGGRWWLESEGVCERKRSLGEGCGRSASGAPGKE